MSAEKQHPPPAKPLLAWGNHIKPIATGDRIDPIEAL